MSGSGVFPARFCFEWCIVKRVVWAVGLIFFGQIVAGTIFGIIWAAIPNQRFIDEWHIYWPFIAGPYLPCAVGICLVRTDFMVRIAKLASVCEVALGVLVVGLTATELWDALMGGEPPGMVFLAPFFGFWAIFGQYSIGCGLLILGLADRFGDTGRNHPATQSSASK